MRHLVCEDVLVTFSECSSLRSKRGNTCITNAFADLARKLG
jgi:hypothetical protein